MQGLMTARFIPGSGSKFLISAGLGVLHVLDALDGTISRVSVSI
jgi:hypothetical protein